MSGELPPTRAGRILEACGFEETGAASAAYALAAFFDEFVKKPMEKAMARLPADRVCPGAKLLDGAGNVVFDFDQDPVLKPEGFPTVTIVRQGSTTPVADEIEAAFAAWAIEPHVQALRDRMDAAVLFLDSIERGVSLDLPPCGGDIAGPLRADELCALLEKARPEKKMKSVRAQPSYLRHDPTKNRRSARGRRR